MLMDKDTSVKVAVRIRPLSDYESVQESPYCISAITSESQVTLRLFFATTNEYNLNNKFQIKAGADSFFTFDYVFGPDTEQSAIYDNCVDSLVKGDHKSSVLSKLSNLTYVCIQLHLRDSMLQYQPTVKQVIAGMQNSYRFILIINKN